MVARCRSKSAAMAMKAMLAEVVARGEKGFAEECER